MTIFLVGFMGCGKSTAGRIAAQAMNYDFVDLDAVIELNAAKTIKQIFETEGEHYFRLMEQQALKDILDRKKTIVAVGGGCPAYEDNMDLMNAHGKTIYIKAHHGVLYHRLAADKKHRPLIAGATDIELMQYIVNNLPVRETFYLKSQSTVETFTEEVNDLAAKIVEEMKHG